MAFTNFSNSPQQDVLPQATKPSTLFSARNLSKGFTPSRCVSCEPRKTPSSLTTPRRNPRTPLAKNAPLCDRFIPVRKGVDHELNSYTLLESLTDGGKEEEAPDEMKSEFQKHVEKELLVKPDKILSFRTKPPKCEDTHTRLRSLYSMNKMAAPNKSTRYISTSAEKVLDAPDVINDFYINVLDWSIDNVVCIALGPCVYMWNADTANLSHLLDMSVSGDELECVTSLCYDASGKILGVGNSRNEVQLWDVMQQKKLRTMSGHESRVSSLSWNGPFLTSGSSSGHIHYHDVRVSDHCMTKVAAHRGEVCGLKWSPDGRHLASGSNDNQIKIWTGVDRMRNPLHTLTDHIAAVKALGWCPWQSSLLASGAGTADRSIKLWNVVTGQCLKSTDTKSQVCGVLWSETYRELISGHGYSQNQLSMWKYPTMTKVCDLMGHTERILHMCCSPANNMVASLAADETLRLWNCFQEDKSKKSQRLKKTSHDRSRSILNHIR
ncbi:cell division cycle protein 20 homolog [Corticium candelabrum]|uniref:cell division cycle protein 20 homolog n=1 Tax=Corticium candelabrum TaxID=121492 RepID=UPI002E2587F4|nr:cell division cycle protein 20 homolog [Corticium candelabrum]